MLWKHPAAVCGVALLLIASASLAFQSPGADPVNIVPRARRAAPPDPDSGREATLRIDSTLVEIPVHATTGDGASVANLTRQDFRVFEDGVEQKITSFTQDDAPLSVGLVFDASGSMHNKIQKSSEAVATFFKTANSQDEFFLVEFNERPKLTIPFTPDSESIYERVAHTKPFGRTSLLDAIHMAMVQMKSAKNRRKAIVIFSDGGDNRSRYTESQIRNGMLESDVQVYAMGIFDPDAQKLSPEEQNGPRLLQELAEQTGGRHYPVGDLNDLAAVSERVSRDLRTEYVLGYSPSHPARDGKYRRIRVEVASPPRNGEKLRLDYRRGYYAPAE